MKLINLLAIIGFVLFEQFNHDDIDVNTRQCHGTLVIAIICHDGIIIASDSRGSFTEILDGKEHAFAYIDSIQKVFLIKNFTVAISGVSMINKKYFYQLTKEFNKSNFNETSFRETFRAFKIFMFKEYGISDSILLENNSFISGFYENGRPKLIAFKKKDSLETSVHNGMIFSDSTAEKTFFSLYHSYKLPLTCENGAFLAEKTIYQFAIDRDKTSEVGGPLHILKISPDNKLTNLKYFKPKIYEDYKDFANSIRSNRTKIIYTDSLGREKVESAINSVLKAWY